MYKKTSAVAEVSSLIQLKLIIDTLRNDPASLGTCFLLFVSFWVCDFVLLRQMCKLNFI